MKQVFHKQHAWLLALTFVACAGGLAQRSFTLSANHLFPFYDEVWYLDNARAIREQHIIPALDSYLLGQNHEDNQHPLYLFLLSFLMDGTARDFVRAKLLSYLQCLLVLIVLMATVYSRDGVGASMACAFLFSFSSVTAHLSQMVLADILFGLLFFLTCWRLTKTDLTKRDWLLIGILCGLTYLTKGNGYLLVPIAIGTALSKKKLCATGPALTFILTGFLITAGFLMWRNILVWHNPFHHLNNKILWLNDWQESFFYKLTPEWDAIGPAWYFQHHSIWNAIKRFEHGAVRQFQREVLLEALALVPFENRWRFIFGGVVGTLSIAGMARSFQNGCRRETAVIGAGMLLIFLPFCFFVEQTVRYVFPIALLLLPYAAFELSRLFKKIEHRAPAVFCAAVFGFTLGTRALLAHPPLSQFKIPAYWRQTTDWIETHAAATDYAVDTWSPYSEWYCCRDKRKPVPYAVREDWLRLFITKNNLQLALVDRLRAAADPFQKKYGPADEHGPTSFLGWPRLFHDDDKPSHFLIYGSVMISSSAPSRHQK